MPKLEHVAFKRLSRAKPRMRLPIGPRRRPRMAAAMGKKHRAAKGNGRVAGNVSFGNNLVQEKAWIRKTVEISRSGGGSKLDIVCVTRRSHPRSLAIMGFGASPIPMMVVPKDGQDESTNWELSLPISLSRPKSSTKQPKEPAPWAKSRFESLFGIILFSEYYN